MKKGLVNLLDEKDKQIRTLKQQVQEYKSEFNKFEIATDLLLTELKKHDSKAEKAIVEFWKALK